MASRSQRQKARDDLPTLEAAIKDLNLAKDTYNLPPAQDAFGSVSDLLSMIGVRSLLFRGDKLLIHIFPGYRGQQSGFHRPWALLC